MSVAVLLTFSRQIEGCIKTDHRDVITIMSFSACPAQQLVRKLLEHCRRGALVLERGAHRLAVWPDGAVRQREGEVVVVELLH